MEKNLEARIKRLEDIEAIKQLMARYCYGVDKLVPQEIVDCFTRDGSAYFDRYNKLARKKIEGYDGLLTWFEGLREILTFSVHMLHNPIIKVDGDKAKGTWYYEVACTHTRGNVAVWIQGRYDNEMVRENGEWKFKSVYCTLNYVTPYSEGWEKQRMMELQRVQTPDGGRTKK